MVESGSESAETSTASASGVAQFERRRLRYMIRKLTLLLCVISFVSACGDSTSSSGDAQSTSGAEDTSDAFSPPPPVITSCPAALGAGQPQSREIVGLWQKCEGPREQGGCSVLDDDGWIFRSDGTFAFLEAAYGGSLEAGEQVCVHTDDRLHGLYRWLDGRLTLVAVTGTELFTEGFCDAPFTVTGDTADHTNARGDKIPYVRIAESRICGDCGAYTLPDGSTGRCP
jgi:hypothetical protein